MCRLALYWGPPILISEFVLKPSRSIIKVIQILFIRLLIFEYILNPSWLIKIALALILLYCSKAMMRESVSVIIHYHSILVTAI